MSTVEVRPFRRTDREQLTSLVNAHVQAVVPGMSVSVNTVLSQLEREPGEFIVDPWVIERTTLVAEQRGRVAAAAHLLRYDDGADIGTSYRGAGEIRWLLCWPDEPSWPDASAAGDAVAVAAIAYLTRSAVSRVPRRRRVAPSNRTSGYRSRPVADVGQQWNPLLRRTRRHCRRICGGGQPARRREADVEVYVDRRFDREGRVDL